MEGSKELLSMAVSKRDNEIEILKPGMMFEECLGIEVTSQQTLDAIFCVFICFHAGCGYPRLLANMFGMQDSSHLLLRLQTASVKVSR